MSEDSKYGHLITGDEFADDDESRDEGSAVAVDMHYLVVNDERASIERYNGLQWHFVIEGGTITAVDKSHYCPGPSHTDPMGFVPWYDVPREVRQRVLEELNASSASAVVDVDATEEVSEA